MRKAGIFDSTNRDWIDEMVSMRPQPLVTTNQVDDLMIESVQRRVITVEDRLYKSWEIYLLYSNTHCDSKQFNILLCIFYQKDSFHHHHNNQFFQKLFLRLKKDLSGDNLRPLCRLQPDEDMPTLCSVRRKKGFFDFEKNLRKRQ